MVFNEELSKSSEYTSLTEEYDKEFNEQKLIEQEERLIEQYEKEFTEKLIKHNMNNTFNHSDNITRCWKTCTKIINCFI